MSQTTPSDPEELKLMVAKSVFMHWADRMGMSNAGDSGSAQRLVGDVFDALDELGYMVVRVPDDEAPNGLGR